MTTTHHIETLKRDGFFLIPGVLSSGEIDRLRDSALAVLRQDESDTMRPSLFLADPVLTGTFFSGKIRALLTTIFGDAGGITLYPNFTVRNNLYINWHTDDFFLPAPLEAATDAPGLYMFNIYLQDNSRERGGGLDVQRGSHRLSRAERDDLIAQNLASDDFFVPSRAGDLVVFDYRVVHRGTVPAGEGRPDRLALQWSMSVGDAPAPVFLSYLRARATRKIHISDFTKHRAQRFFNDMPAIDTPDLVRRADPSFFDGRVDFASFRRYLTEDVAP